jgi:hypothetical protein
VTKKFTVDIWTLRVAIGALMALAHASERR